MRRLWLSLIWVIPCLAQPPRLNFTGEISGSLTGEDGTKIAGGYVSLRRLPPHPARLRQTSWTTVTGTGGTFRFEGLNDGRYQLCAQFPKGTWLNPCEWGPEPQIVALSAAQGFAAVALVIKRAAVVPIRLEDPGQLLAQNEGKTAGAQVLAGVANDARWFRPAVVTSRDAGAKNYEVLIPFNTPRNLNSSLLAPWVPILSVPRVPGRKLNELATPLNSSRSGLTMRNCACAGRVPSATSRAQSTVRALLSWATPILLSSRRPAESHRPPFRWVVNPNAYHTCIQGSTR